MPHLPGAPVASFQYLKSSSVVTEFCEYFQSWMNWISDLPSRSTIFELGAWFCDQHFKFFVGTFFLTDLHLSQAKLMCFGWRFQQWRRFIALKEWSNCCESARALTCISWPSCVTTQPLFRPIGGCVMGAICSRTSSERVSFPNSTKPTKHFDRMIYILPQWRLPKQRKSDQFEVLF